MSTQRLPNHFVRAVPDGDTLERDVCDTCGFVHYQNPKVVVGSVVHHGGQILLCRRAIWAIGPCQQATWNSARALLKGQ